MLTYFWSSVWAILLVAIIIGVFHELEDMLLYHPNEPSTARIFVPSPSLYKLPFEEVFITASDGTKLHTYLILQPNSLARRIPTVVILHGNAGNIGYMLHVAHGFFHNVSTNVLLLEYRGYGLSEGRPSESGLYLDAEAAIEYLRSRTDAIDTTRIVLYGTSLGGAVALRTAATLDPTALLLVIAENTFTSLPSIGRLLVGYGPLKLLPDWCFRNQYQSRQRVPLISAPLLFVSSLDDELVPPAMVDSLRESCRSRRCYMMRLPGVGHNDAHTSYGYWESIRSHISSLLHSGG